MSKSHIAVRCKSCGATVTIPWPTSRKRGAEVECPSCRASFSVAEAVDDAVLSGGEDHAPFSLGAKKPLAEA